MIREDFLSVPPDLSLHIMDPNELELQLLFMFLYPLDIVFGWFRKNLA